MFENVHNRSNTTHVLLKGRIVLELLPNESNLTMEFERGWLDASGGFVSRGTDSVFIPQYLPGENDEANKVANPLFTEAIMTADLSYDNLESFLKKALGVI